MKNKIIRSVCLFSKVPKKEHVVLLDSLVTKLERSDYIIQTKRYCSPVSIKDINSVLSGNKLYLSVGQLNTKQVSEQFNDFINAENTSFNLELKDVEITREVVDILFRIIKEKPSKTFNFTYTFNNAVSSPYFPSAIYNQDGFALGLQPTDTSEGCNSVAEWLDKLKLVWDELNLLFKDFPNFLGIDSSIAPLFEGNSSFVNLIKRVDGDFSSTVTTDVYTQITKFIKESNPKPLGLCGLMLPCLEDFELAKEYELGNFSLERNIYLSLHSGLGIDTYPIAVDENPEKVLSILKLVQALSNKYSKPLSVRFVSDGKAKVGELTKFNNPFLKDVVVKKL